MSEIIICSDFFDSFCKLPSCVQTKVRYFFDKFSENHLINGFNYEMINQVNGKQLYSARINDAYRAIIYEDKTEKKFYILWVDKHDDAYAWAKNKKTISIETSNVSVMSKKEYLNRGLHTKNNSNLFSGISTKNLIKLGVKNSEIEQIRSIPDMKTLESYKELFTPDVYSNLEWIANDFHVRDILEYNKMQREEILDYIKEMVLFPALNCKELNDDIKESVKDTYNRLENKTTTKEILDFFEDALIARRGGIIHSEFQKLGLNGFEEIADDIRKISSR